MDCDTQAKPAQAVRKNCPTNPECSPAQSNAARTGPDNHSLEQHSGRTTHAATTTTAPVRPVHLLPLPPPFQSLAPSGVGMHAVRVPTTGNVHWMLPRRIVPAQSESLWPLGASLPPVRTIDARALHPIVASQCILPKTNWHTTPNRWIAPSVVEQLPNRPRTTTPPADSPDPQWERIRLARHMLSASESAAAGAFAGAVARFTIAPLDVLKIRFQLQLEPSNGKVGGACHRVAEGRAFG